MGSKYRYHGLDQHLKVDVDHHTNQVNKLLIDDPLIHVLAQDLSRTTNKFLHPDLLMQEFIDQE